MSTSEVPGAALSTETNAKGKTHKKVSILILEREDSQ